MLNVVIDTDRCQGYANCLMESELFDLGPDNQARFLAARVPQAARAEVDNAVHACPAAALRLVQQ